MKIGLIGNVKKIGDASVIENLVLSLRECGHFVTMFSAYHEINGVDLVISSDIPHHVIVACDNLGISVISLTHYASEFFGFLKFYEQTKAKILKSSLAFQSV